MKARNVLSVAGLASAIGLGAILMVRSGTPTPAGPYACPRFTPMLGLMPLLFRVGLLPKPPIARTIIRSSTATSSVIRPERGDQIQCGKAPINTIKDVIYASPQLAGGSPIPLKLDILIPESTRKRTLVVYVPGGGFMMAAKESALNLRTYVAEAGFAVASVQYRTARDGATYREGVEDIKAAIRYLRGNAARYVIDAGPVVVWGESAGGYLAAMVGVTNQDGAFNVGANLNQSSAVQGVIDAFGASDISKLAADYDSMTQQATYASEGLVKYIGRSSSGDNLDAGIASTTANPLTYVRASAPPFLLFHGNQDRMVSPSQTLILHDALTAAGARSTRYVVDGAGHGDLSFIGDTQSGLPWSTRKVMNLIVDFLNAVNSGT